MTWLIIKSYRQKRPIGVLKSWIYRLGTLNFCSSLRRYHSNLINWIENGNVFSCFKFLETSKCIQSPLPFTAISNRVRTGPEACREMLWFKLGYSAIFTVFLCNIVLLYLQNNPAFIIGFPCTSTVPPYLALQCKTLTP